MELVLFEPAQKFTRDRLYVLLGNSTLAGTGALDKQFLNRQLARDQDVLNVALGGHGLDASTAFAMLTLGRSLDKHKPLRLSSDRFTHPTDCI